MISSRNSSRRSGISRAGLALAALFIFAAPSLAFAQGGIRQYSRQFTLGGRLPTSILLVGWEKDAADIEKLLDVVISKANDVASRLDGQNPSSDVALLAAKGSVQTTPEVAAAFEVAKKVCEWTGGAFDIVAAGEGSCRDLKVDKESVVFKKPGATLRFDPILSGVLSELMARLIFASGMQNAIVKVGNVFRGVGQGLHGPWKVLVEDDAGTFAHHALNLTVANTGIAAVSASQYRAAPAIDPRSKQPVAAPCRGVVAVMNDAAEADGIAYATFILGPEKGMALLSKYAKGLIVDSAGQFMRTPGF